MAKGKHGTAAANRRYEAAAARIDRLTSELVEAKARARKVESEARRVPTLVAAVADLQRQLTALDSDKVTQLRHRAALDIEAARAETVELGLVLLAAVDVAGVKLTAEEFAVVGRIMREDYPAGPGEPRRNRRAIAFASEGLMGELVRQSGSPSPAPAHPLRSGTD